MRARLFDNREHTILNACHKKTAEDELWESLAACIILQACKDYDCRSNSDDGYGIDVNRESAIRFLRSQYYDMLSTTGVTGEELMRHIDKYGMPQVSIEMIIGTGRKKANYGKEGEQSAGAL